MCDDGLGGDNGSMTHGHLRANDRAVTDPGVVADDSLPAMPYREECFIALGIIPVVIRAIEKMMQGGAMHWVISRPDAGKAADIGKFPDLGIGDIRVSIAVAVVPMVERWIREPRPISTQPPNSLSVISQSGWMKG